MYADELTGSMEKAIDETNRRRRIDEEDENEKINTKISDTLNSLLYNCI